MKVDDDNDGLMELELTNKYSLRFLQSLTTWLTLRRRRRRRLPSSPSPTPSRLSPPRLGLLSGLLLLTLEGSQIFRLSSQSSWSWSWSSLSRVELPNIPAGIGAQSTQPIFTHQLFKVHRRHECHHHQRYFHHHHHHHHHHHKDIISRLISNHHNHHGNIEYVTAS